jgi:hypothetical protein
MITEGNLKSTSISETIIVMKPSSKSERIELENSCKYNER